MAQDDWVTLLRVREEETASVIAGLLDSAGIPNEVIDRAASELPIPAVDSMSRIEIMVPGEQADEARALLNDSREGTAPCRSCGHRSSAEEVRCEYCDAAM